MLLKEVKLCANVDAKRFTKPNLVGDDVPAMMGEKDQGEAGWLALLFQRVAPAWNIGKLEI